MPALDLRDDRNCKQVREECRARSECGTDFEAMMRGGMAHSLQSALSGAMSLRAVGGAGIAGRH